MVYPLFTFELKNEGTGQNYTHGIAQYRTQRNAENRMLRNCLVHFVMDNQYVFMTTKLNGEGTTFLPFNRETVNPTIEGDYPTAYMWRDILQAELPARPTVTLHQTLLMKVMKTATQRR